MIPRVVRRGEYLARIAHECGFGADAVWSDPSNADLKKRRKDPHMLVVGDILQIPESTRIFLPVSIGIVNKFKVNVPMVDIQLKLVDRNGPLKGAACRITGVPNVETATADGEGVVKLQVPISVRSVTVDVDKPRFHAMMLVGHMDPPDTESGIRMRLRNLHFLHDDQAPPEHFGMAVGAFQRKHQLPDSGVVDDATRSAIMAAHGC